jgi:hypothetical protein
MKQPEEVRKLVAAGVSDMVARLRISLSNYHADETEALERIKRPEFVEGVTSDLMERFSK